jgi:hypothetical protein
MRTEAQILTREPVTVTLAGREYAIEPALGIRWVRLTQRLVALMPREEIRKRLGSASLASYFDPETIGERLPEIVDLLIGFAAERLEPLYELLVDALGLPDEDRRHVYENASPAEIVVAVKGVGPIVFPLDQLGEAMAALGLTADEEDETEAPATANGAPVPKRTAV